MTLLLHEAVASTTSRLKAEAWDHTTVRLNWEFDALVAQALSELATDTDEATALERYNARLAITRSVTGTPVTPLDGVRIFLSDPGVDVSVEAPITGSETSFDPAAPYLQGHLPGVSFPVDVVSDVRTDDTVRPYSDTPSIYDRNLIPGRVYYYTAFLLVPDDDPDGELFDGVRWSWKPFGSGSCRLAGDYDHFSKLYELFPPYYRYVDQLNLAGTYQTRGYLEQFTQVIGHQLDATRALAENIQQVYDIDKTDERLLYHLAKGNFGYEPEPGLGNIRYRGITANLPRAYRARGSLLGLHRLASPATQYPTRVVDGTNLFRLADDHTFESSTGLWTGDHIANVPGYGDTDIRYNILPASSFLLGDTLPSDTLVQSTITRPTSPVPGFPTRKGTYATVSAQTSPSNFFGAYYGMGTQTNTNNRFHTEQEVELYLQETVIPIKWDTEYRFSVYLRRTNQTPVIGWVRIGFVFILTFKHVRYGQGGGSLVPLSSWMQTFTNDPTAELKPEVGGEDNQFANPLLVYRPTLLSDQPTRFQTSLVTPSQLLLSQADPAINYYPAEVWMRGMFQLAAIPVVLFSGSLGAVDMAGAMLTEHPPVYGGGSIYPFVVES